MFAFDSVALARAETMLGLVVFIRLLVWCALLTSGEPIKPVVKQDAFIVAMFLVGFIGSAISCHYLGR